MTTTQTPSPTTILVCSECSIGHYVRSTPDPDTYVCSELGCSHSITADDITLEFDEHLTYTPFGLGYFTTDNH